jgi:murein L,D-transpeptidase YafK
MTIIKHYKKLCLSLFLLSHFEATALRADALPFAKVALLPTTTLENNQWIWIDTKHKKLTLMDNNSPFKVFTHAAFGSGGIGYKHKRGDNITPKGVYRIGWNNDKSDFRNFFGLTYPSIPDAENGLKHNLINADEYKAIVDANLQHTVPPQDTALGGAIGIHGLGTPIRRVIKHRTLNWTEGCIALTNEQIDELAIYVKAGMMVVID